jgi:hypothetical protein
MLRRVVVAATVATLVGCPAASPPPVAITDCGAEAKLVLEKAEQSRGCRVDAECTLLKIDGLSPCGAPVAASAEPALRERALRWRATCKPTHADCIGNYVPRCDSGTCAAVQAQGGY